MADFSSSSGVETAVRSGFQQFRVVEARRTAERMEEVARRLQAQAATAQRTADRAQDDARSLTVQSEQARDDAGRARQGVAYLDALGRMQNEVGRVVGRVAERLGVPATPDVKEVAAAPPAPVVNTQGQVTGTLVSTTA